MSGEAGVQNRRRAGRSQARGVHEKSPVVAPSGLVRLHEHIDSNAWEATLSACSHRGFQLLTSVLGRVGPGPELGRQTRLGLRREHLGLGLLVEPVAADGRNRTHSVHPVRRAPQASRHRLARGTAQPNRSVGDAELERPRINWKKRPGRA